jgi:hypothetical protein
VKRKKGEVGTLLRLRHHIPAQRRGEAVDEVAPGFLLLIGGAEVILFPGLEGAYKLGDGGFKHEGEPTTNDRLLRNVGKKYI